MSEIKFVFHAPFKRKLAAVKKAPKLAAEAQVASAKKAACQVVFNFQDGLRRNNFHLRPLKAETEARKRKLGMSLPHAPLYGLGLEDRDSYINGLVVRRYRAGSRVRTVITPSRRLHHAPVTQRGKRGKRVPLALLLHVHEHGAFIKQGHGIVVLPPRPAVRLAWERTLRKLRERTRGAAMRAALAEYIKTSKEVRFRAMARFNEKERQILDQRD